MSGTITNHAYSRVADRLLANGVSPDDVGRIMRDAFNFKADPFTSYALRWSMPHMVGQAWSDLSNGDTIVAIIRAGVVQTFMFRRRTQPFDKASLNVDKVVNL